MAVTTQTLIRKIQALPPEKLGEVEDFVDFLAAKSCRLAAIDRLLATTLPPSKQPAFRR